MQRFISLSLAAFALVGPSLASLPLGPGARAVPHAPVAASELLQASRVDLGSMRAGRATLPCRIDTGERAALAAASQHAPALGDMRAGFRAPTDREWMWIGIGAGAVLLIIILA